MAIIQNKNLASLGEEKASSVLRAPRPLAEAARRARRQGEPLFALRAGAIAGRDVGGVVWRLCASCSVLLVLLRAPLRARGAGRDVALRRAGVW